VDSRRRGDSPEALEAAEPYHRVPNGRRLSGERGGEAEERVRCTRGLGGIRQAFTMRSPPFSVVDDRPEAVRSMEGLRGIFRCRLLALPWNRIEVRLQKKRTRIRGEQNAR
jgi:hypothetical protein